MKNDINEIKGYKAANIAYNVIFIINSSFIVLYLLLRLCSKGELDMMFEISVVYKWLYIAGMYAFASLALKIVVPVIALVVAPCLAAWLVKQMYKGVKSAKVPQKVLDYYCFAKDKNGKISVSPFSKKAIIKEWYVGVIPLAVTALSYFLLGNSALLGTQGYLKTCTLVIVTLLAIIAVLFVPVLIISYIGKCLFFKDAIKYCK